MDWMNLRVPMSNMLPEGSLLVEYFRECSAKGGSLSDAARQSVGDKFGGEDPKPWQLVCNDSVTALRLFLVIYLANDF